MMKKLDDTSLFVLNDNFNRVSTLVEYHVKYSQVSIKRAARLTTYICS